MAARSSFENVAEKWVPELRKYTKDVPFILVGTQSDRRAPSSGPETVSQKEGIALAKRLGAAEYAECSAKTRNGLRDVFVGAIMTALKGPQQGAGPAKAKRGPDGSGAVFRKKSRCCIS